MIETKDERELEWWRRRFVCRFGKAGLPKPGTPLYGMRFVLMVKVGDDLIPWAEFRNPTTQATKETKEP